MSILRGETVPLPKQVLIHKLFEDTANAISVREKIAIHYEGIQLTYLQLNNEANKVRQFLQLKLWNGKSPTGRCIIAVQMEPSHHVIISLLAILKMGGAYLPLDPFLPKERLRHILVDAKPQCVLTDKHSTLSHMENVPFISIDECLHSTNEIKNKAEDRQDLESMCEGSPPLFAVIYTSGSTGVPKGICLPHRALLNRLSWQWKQFPYQNNEVCCWKTSLLFVDSVTEIFSPLLKGIPLVIPTKSAATNVEMIVSILNRHSVSRLTLVPSLLRMILLYLEMSPREKHLTKLKLWVCSGEEFPKDLLIKFFQLFPAGHTICNFYGSTEVMADVTFELFSSTKDVSLKVPNEKVPIGKPIDNTRIYLLDDKLKVVPSGEIGEIFVSSTNLSAGTVKGNDDGCFFELTLTGNRQETLYKTGDFGQIINGILFYEGRKDSQVKVRGNRVDLIEIEAAMRKIKGIVSVAVLCHYANSVNQTIVAYYSKDGNLIEEDLKYKLRQHLPQYMIPELFEVNEIPVLPNSGKVNRQELHAMYEASKKIVHWEHQVQTLKTDEKKKALALFKSIRSVLGSSGKEILLNKSFFEIGGNSLNSILVMRQLIEEGYSVDMAYFLKSPTLKDLFSNMKEIPELDNEVSHSTALFKRTVSFVPLSEVDEQEGSDLIAMSFAINGTLEQTIQRMFGGLEVLKRHYRETVESVWESCVSKGISFGAVDSEGKLQGMSLSIEYDEVFTLDPSHYGITMRLLLELCLHILDTIKDEIPTGRIVYSFAVGVNPGIPPSDRLEVITAIEQENVRLAREKGFDGIMSINVSPVTQQLTEFVLGYKILARIQVNEFEFPDGSRPYALCADEDKVTVALNMF